MYVNVCVCVCEHVSVCACEHVSVFVCTCTEGNTTKRLSRSGGYKGAKRTPMGLELGDLGRRGA